MSAPERDELTSAARAILDAGRDLDGPGDLERARVRRLLLAKIAAGGTALAASSAAASGPVPIGAATTTTAAATGTATTSSVLAAPVVKALVALTLVGGGVGGGFAWKARRDARPAAPAVVATNEPARVPAPPTLAPAPLPVVAPRAPTPVHHVHVAAPVRDEVPANRLAEETALLATANAELRGGDARHALALLDDYERRYPSGVLREEVLATRVIARCQVSVGAGPAPDATARRAAAAFLARHAASPLAPRVRSSCER
ncbi:MAG TPA: hypothetical protein VHJ20_21570 [Polyangia bacterium]|nr:hypothetical protein [Polyangia bacterium]